MRRGRVDQVILVNRRTDERVHYRTDARRKDTTDVEVIRYGAQDRVVEHGILSKAEARTHYRNRRAEGFE